MTAKMKNSILLTTLVSLVVSISVNASLVSGISGFQVTNGIATYAWGNKLLDGQAAITSDPSDQEVFLDAKTAMGANTGWTGDLLGFDFSTDYASKTFNQVYMLQGSYSTTDLVANYYWSSDKTFDGGDVAAPNLNLFNYTNYSNDTNGRWELEYDNPAGVTPQERYLIAEYVSGNAGNFAYEAAFVAIPEPSPLVLMGFAIFGFVFFCRHRN